MFEAYWNVIRSERNLSDSAVEKYKPDAALLEVPFCQADGVEPEFLRPERERTPNDVFYDSVARGLWRMRQRDGSYVGVASYLPMERQQPPHLVPHVGLSVLMPGHRQERSVPLPVPSLSNHRSLGSARARAAARSRSRAITTSLASKHLTRRVANL